MYLFKRYKFGRLTTNTSYHKVCNQAMNKRQQFGRPELVEVFPVILFGTFMYIHKRIL